MNKMLTFDIMVDGKYFTTMHVRVELEHFWTEDSLEYAIDVENLKAKVLEKFPTLKNKNYQICF